MQETTWTEIETKMKTDISRDHHRHRLELFRKVSSRSNLATNDDDISDRGERSSDWNGELACDGDDDRSGEHARDMDSGRN
ncbi:hypothetical protein TIFTF001_055328 [Ficus carica]|uniref:Uncharacterized protein n=1 Tax=Ficus carica TaxID=3494 RepID=A0AA88EEB1_FICCA|nr:hypothetical protein TIFTF001_055327 [Ficus carica]GMN73232.1 hypothetical protein TIFTF001_055328 [Ficus carica]